jgi:hypothetical protein
MILAALVKAHTGLQISFLTDDDLHRRPVAGYLAGATRVPRHGMPPSWGPLAGFFPAGACLWAATPRPKRACGLATIRRTQKARFAHSPCDLLQATESSGFFGGRTRTRTLDPLIKSELPGRQPIKAAIERRGGPVCGGDGRR